MSSPNDADVSVVPAPRGNWPSYREHAVVIVHWIATMARQLDDPTVVSKVAIAEDDVPTLLLLSRRLAQAGHTLPANVETSIRHCLVLRRRFVEWTTLHRGSHHVSPGGAHSLRRTLDVAALEQVLADFNRVDLSTAGEVTTASPFSPSSRPPDADCGAIHDVPFGVFLLLEDIHNIREHVASAWRGYRANHVSLASASLTTHAAMEVIEALDLAATAAGAPHSHGMKIGTLIHYLALGESNTWGVSSGNMEEAQQAACSAIVRFNESGFQISPALDLWLMRDISIMLLDAANTRDRPVNRILRQTFRGDEGVHIDQDWRFILCLRQFSSSIPRQPTPERFLDYFTVHISRAEESGKGSLLTDIAGARILLDIHQIDRSDMTQTALREAYNVRQLLAQDQLNHPGDSSAVRDLKRTSRLFLRWIDPQAGFPGSRMRTVNPVLCGLAVAFLGEMKNAMQNPEQPNPAAPVLRRLRENYVEATWDRDLFGRTPLHAEHRLLPFRDTELDDDPPAATDPTCVEYLTRLSSVLEVELRNVVPTAPTAAAAEGASTPTP